MSLKKIFLYVVLAFLIIATYVGFDLYSKIGSSPSSEQLKEFEKLSYFKDGEFQSLLPITYEPEKVRNGPAGFVRFFTTSRFAPKHSLPKVVLDKESFSSTPEEFAIFWLGHSSAIMDIKGKRVIFDPVLDNAAPLSFAVPRFDISPIKREDLPKVDFVVITHNHYDHLEKESIQSIDTKLFIVPLGVGQTLENWGVPKEKIVEIGWGEKYEKDGLSFVAKEGVHYSGRASWDKNQTLWNSYVLLSEDMKIFWGGDTGYSEHFKKIGEEFGGFDFVALEIDGWNPAWRRTHLFPNEVIQAAKDLNAKVLLPIHWGVFDLALHPWNESIDMVLDEAKDTNIDIKTPKMGEKIDLNSTTTKWWR